MSDTKQSLAPTRAPPTTPLAKVKTLQEAFDHPQFMKRIQDAVPRTMQPERMLRVFVQAVQRTPKLMQVPVMQLVGAFMQCSLIGLEPNTPLGHCYLIPFDKNKRVNGKWEYERTDVNLIIGYSGLIDLSYRSGMVLNIMAQVVWAGDDFSFSYGTDGHLRHRPNGQPHEDGERPSVAYMHAQLKGGAQGYEVLPYREVLMTRNSSQGYQSALRARDAAAAKGWTVPATWTEAPWVKHEIAMARKTALRAGSKYLPRSIEMAMALQLDETQDRRLLNFAAGVIDPEQFTLGVPTQDEEEGAGPTIEQDPPAETAAETRRPNTSAPRQPPAPSRPRAAAPRQPDPKPDPAPQHDDDPGPDPDDPGYGTADATQQTGQPSATPEAEYFLSDEFGEPVDGENGYTTSAVRFVEFLRAAWEKSTNRATLLENNGDALAEARAANPEAEQLYGSLDWMDGPAAETETKAEPEAKPEAKAAPSWPLELPTKNGRPDLVAAVAMFRTAVAEISDPVTMRQFMTAHEPMIARLPSVTRSNINTVLATRAGELGVETINPDRAWLEHLLANDVPKITSVAAVKAHLGAGAIAARISRIERESPDVFAWFKEAINQHIIGMGGKA